MKITVNLDPDIAARIERVAGSRRQTTGDFLAAAGEEVARRALLDEAIARFEADPDNVSFAELAAEYGLWVEEIMQEIWDRTRAAVAATGQTPRDVARATWRGDPERAEEMFLAGSRTLAEARHDPDLLRRAEEAVAQRRAARRPAASS